MITGKSDPVGELGDPITVTLRFTGNAAAALRFSCFYFGRTPEEYVIGGTVLWLKCDKSDAWGQGGDADAEKWLKREK